MQSRDFEKERDLLSAITNWWVPWHKFHQFLNGAYILQAPDLARLIYLQFHNKTNGFKREPVNFVDLKTFFNFFIVFK